MLLNNHIAESLWKCRKTATIYFLLEQNLPVTYTMSVKAKCVTMKYLAFTEIVLNKNCTVTRRTPLSIRDIYYDCVYHIKIFA